MAWKTSFKDLFAYNGDLVTNGGWTIVGGGEILDGYTGYATHKASYTTTNGLNWYVVPTADLTSKGRFVIKAEITKANEWEDSGTHYSGFYYGFLLNGASDVLFLVTEQQKLELTYKDDAGVVAAHYLQPDGTFGSSYTALSFDFTGTEEWIIDFEFVGNRCKFRFKDLVWEFSTFLSGTGPVTGDKLVIYNDMPSATDIESAFGAGNSYHIKEAYYLDNESGTFEKSLLTIDLDNSGTIKLSACEPGELCSNYVEADNRVNRFGKIVKTLNWQRGLFSISNATIALDNTDNYFSELVSTERAADDELHNREATLQLIDPSLPECCWRTVYSGKIQNYYLVENTFYLEISDLFLTDIATKKAQLGTMQAKDFFPSAAADLTYAFAKTLDAWESNFLGTKKRVVYGYTSVDDAYSSSGINGLCGLVYAGMVDRGYKLNHGSVSPGTFSVGAVVTGQNSGASGTIYATSGTDIDIIKTDRKDFDPGETITDDAGTPNSAVLNSSPTSPPQVKNQDWYFYYAGEGTDVTIDTNGLYLDEISADISKSAPQHGFGLYVQRCAVAPAAPATLDRIFYVVLAADDVKTLSSMNPTADIIGEKLDVIVGGGSPGPTFNHKAVNPVWIIYDILTSQFNISADDINYDSFERAALICKWMGVYAPGGTPDWSYPGYRCAYVLEDGMELAKVLNEICQTYLLDFYVDRYGKANIAVQSEASCYSIDPIDHILLDSFSIAPRWDYLLNKIYVKHYYRFAQGKYFLNSETGDSLYDVTAAFLEGKYGREYEFNYDGKLHCDTDTDRNGSDTGGGIDSMQAGVYNYLQCYGEVNDHVKLSLDVTLDNIDFIELKKTHTISHTYGFNGSSGEMDEEDYEVFSIELDMDNHTAQIEYRPTFTPTYDEEGT